MTKLHKGQGTLLPIPVCLKVWSQISIDLLEPLKEVVGYKYIVTAVYYTSKFVEAEAILQMKTGSW